MSEIIIKDSWDFEETSKGQSLIIYMKDETRIPKELPNQIESALKLQELVKKEYYKSSKDDKYGMSYDNEFCVECGCNNGYPKKLQSLIEESEK